MKTGTLRVALATTAVLALSGCNNDDVESAKDRAQSAADQGQQKAEQKAYEGLTIAALAAIDRNLTSNPSNALIQAKAVCYVIENKNANQAAAEAQKRFTTKSVRVNQTMAKQIVKVLKKDLCPKLK